MAPMSVELAPSGHPEWAAAARSLAERVSALLSGAAVEGAAVEHIGSTSVPGLTAKPVVDLMIGVDAADLPAATATLAAAGFDLEGSTPTRSSFAHPHREAREAVLHVVPLGSRFWERRLRFRDLLRTDAGARECYLAVKRAAAAAHPGDWDGYTQAKNDVVAGLLEERHAPVSLRLETPAAAGADVERWLQAAGVRLNEHARTLLNHPGWAAQRFPEARFVWPDDHGAPSAVQVTFRSGWELGLPSGGTWAEVLRVATHRGLGACPLSLAPALRLELTDQAEAPDSVLSAGRPPSGAIHVASEPLEADADFPRGFYLRTVEGTPWLRGFTCDEDYILGPECVFAFLAPAAWGGR